MSKITGSEYNDRISAMQKIWEKYDKLEMKFLAKMKAESTVDKQCEPTA
jgi:hypothetical protein